MYCDDCGTKLSGGVCPNCSEELYIFENQYDDLPELSIEFAKKVEEQKAAQQSKHPTESGGWVCSKCKTINSQEWSDCCFCDTPRIGG